MSTTTSIHATVFAIIAALTLGCRGNLSLDSSAKAGWQPAAGSALATHRDYDDTGPLHLMMTYRCEPVNRAAFAAYLVGTAAERLAGWRDDGLVADYQVFLNSYIDEGTYDAMVLLRFADYERVAQWEAIERTMPGGLDARGLELATPILDSSADVVWDNVGHEPAADKSESVFLMIPYDYLGLVSEYKDYVDGYVIPQLEGWLEAGVLRSYRVALNRFPTGDRWMSYLLLEYRSHEAFGRRKHTKYAVREGLESDRVWSDYSSRKRTIRSEREPVIVRCLAASPGQ